jgi:hypothetical protein
MLVHPGLEKLIRQNCRGLSELTLPNGRPAFILRSPSGRTGPTVL